jgi:hypothetical protein
LPIDDSFSNPWAGCICVTEPCPCDGTSTGSPYDSVLRTGSHAEVGSAVGQASRTIGQPIGGIEVKLVKKPPRSLALSPTVNSFPIKTKGAGRVYVPPTVNSFSIKTKGAS